MWRKWNENVTGHMTQHQLGSRSQTDMRDRLRYGFPKAYKHLSELSKNGTASSYKLCPCSSDLSSSFRKVLSPCHLLKFVISPKMR